ncbi:hypothetical protein [Sphingomonas psychrotolerans]|uniref:Protein activator of alkane oxidation PraB n=1 Tax=Sphingomonas psychrotolerans TaxID=1327635 RepID=A0A2K8MAW8_9SPHN|nr:hypothetical protein [Sphingomonas psychrotolerans]ATY31013.1 hypothetical protein CVN68_02605 [Sphingomonas psychrotolerans]
MIKKILAAGALVASVAFIAPQASAQTFSPNGAVSLASIGNITVSKGITLSCGLAGTGSVSSGALSVSSITLSGGLCPSVTFSGTPYTVTSGSLTAVTLNGVVVTAITGNCAGTLTGAYNQATGVITYANATIPSTSGGSPCRVTGRVQVSPTVTFTIP